LKLALLRDREQGRVLEQNVEEMRCQEILQVFLALLKVPGVQKR